VRAPTEAPETPRQLPVLAERVREPAEAGERRHGRGQEDERAGQADVDAQRVANALGPAIQRAVLDGEDVVDVGAVGEVRHATPQLGWGSSLAHTFRRDCPASDPVRRLCFADDGIGGHLRQGARATNPRGSTRPRDHESGQHRQQDERQGFHPQAN